MARRPLLVLKALAALALLLGAADAGAQRVTPGGGGKTQPGTNTGGGGRNTGTAGPGTQSTVPDLPGSLGSSLPGRGGSHEDPEARVRRELEAARALHKVDPGAFTRAEPFIWDMPRLQVRVPAGRTDYDFALTEKMRGEYGEALTRPLAARDIHVAATDFSSRPEVEAEERAAFLELIPKPNRTLAPALARLLRRPGGDIDMAELREALAPYGGQVLVLIGHIDRKTGRMTVTSGGRPTPIDLDLWRGAARERGVQLLPLGCYSARHAGIGSPDLVNSREMLRALAATLARPMRNWGDFYRLLTASPRVTLTVDPFGAALSYARIAVAVDGREAGEVQWMRAEALAQGPAGGGGGPCGETVSGAAYETCRAAARAAALRGWQTEAAAAGEERQRTAARLRLAVILFMLTPFLAAIPAGIAGRIEDGERAWLAPAFWRSYGLGWLGRSLLHLGALSLFVLPTQPRDYLLAALAGWILLAAGWLAVAWRRSGWNRPEALWRAASAAIGLAAFAALLAAHADWQAGVRRVDGAIAGRRACGGEERPAAAGAACFAVPEAAAAAEQRRGLAR